MRLNELQFYHLAAQGRDRPRKCGILLKKTGKKTTGTAAEFPGIRWQKRFAVLHYNMLFYYENEFAVKPQGLIMLEGTECHRIFSYDKKLFCFVIGIPMQENRRFMFATESEYECNDWIKHFSEASGAAMMEKNKALTEKATSLESQLQREKEAKGKLQRECSDQWAQIARLKLQVSNLKCQNQRNSISSNGSRDSTGTNGSNSSAASTVQLGDQDFSDKDCKRIVKLQAVIRGWSARARWRCLKEMFITSPNADLLSQRNALVWQFLTSEEDYVQQLTTLVGVFLKPLRVAAESGADFISREEVDKLFLNSEALLLLHEMFLKGLKSRLEHWPLVQLDDFFHAMVSMMSMYHDYVRNHPVALQTLAACKQRQKFRRLLKWYEQKPECHGQTIEQLLHHPVQLISTYIRSVHDILLVTPADHPEKSTLEKVLEKLEDVHLSLNEHLCDGESRRHTLDIERTINGGCDVLLDPDQKFIRHGILRQLGLNVEQGGQRREKTRHCFLFSKHFIITSRTSDGTLRLAKECGIVPLMKAVLIEDGEEEGMSLFGRAVAFTLQVNSREQNFSVTLLSVRTSDKAVWTSDISQCIYNLSLECTGSEEGSEFSQGDSLERDYVLQRPLSIPEEMQADEEVPSTPLMSPTRLIVDAQKSTPIAEDTRLMEDADDIKYSKNVGVCNLPQIQLASVDRLLERLVDPRIPGTDYMDTFLLTYRLFTDGKYVLQYLMDCYHSLENGRFTSPGRGQGPLSMNSRRTSGVVTSDRSSTSSSSPSTRRNRGSSIISNSSMSSQEELNRAGRTPPTSPTSASFWIAGTNRSRTNGVAYSNDDESVFEMEMESSRKLSKPYFLHANHYSKDDADDVLQRRRKTSPAIFAGVQKSESVEDLLSSSLIGPSILDSNPSAPGSVPRVALQGEMVEDGDTKITVSCSPIKHIRSASNPDNSGNSSFGIERGRSFASRLIVRESMESKRLSLPDIPRSDLFEKESNKLGASPLLRSKQFDERLMRGEGDTDSLVTTSGSDGDIAAKDRVDPVENETPPKHKTLSSTSSNPLSSQSKGRKQSDEKSKKKSFLPNALKAKYAKRTMSRSVGDKLKQSVENLFFGEEKDVSPDKTMKSRDVRALAEELQNAGDLSRRGSSIESVDISDRVKSPEVKNSKKEKKSSKGDTLSRKAQTRKISRVSIRAVLPNRGPLKIMNVLKHWLSKHYQDFERSSELLEALKACFSDLKEAEFTLPVVKEIICNMERSIENQQQIGSVTQMDEILAIRLTPEEATELTLDMWTPQSIAENLTLLEHYLYARIPSYEFLSCSWTHKDKETRAPNILRVIRRFNQVSNMIAHEVIHLPTPDERAKRMEFWIATAALCRDLNNFNSVLQIIGALTNSAVYRLKKSWTFVSKHLKAVLQDLQSLVTTDKSFRQLRQAIHKCNPPCVPYIGFYLSDLLFVDEGASNYNGNLVNFAKMNRISRLVREIKQYQQLRYTLEFSEELARYLVASHVKTNEDELYDESLLVEPREQTPSKQESPPLILSMPPKQNRKSLKSPVKEQNEDPESFEERLIM